MQLSECAVGDMVVFPLLDCTYLTVFRVVSHDSDTGMSIVFNRKKRTFTGRPSHSPCLRTLTATEAQETALEGNADAQAKL